MLQLIRTNRNSRLETVVAFAQSVYLIFASVYVCKETVEHLLLSSGEGHHHHHRDETAQVFGWVLFNPCCRQQAELYVESSFQQFYC